MSPVKFDIDIYVIKCFYSSSIIALLPMLHFNHSTLFVKSATEIMAVVITFYWMSKIHIFLNGKFVIQGKTCI